MANEVRVKNTGLRGVTVADSKISYIDGDQGVLIYRGFRIVDLSQGFYPYGFGRFPPGEPGAMGSAEYG